MQIHLSKSLSEQYSCIICLVSAVVLESHVHIDKRVVAGVSCFIGLAVTCLFLPMNHYASKVVVVAQDNLMKARDERVALMNEVGPDVQCCYFILFILVL